VYRIERERILVGREVAFEAQLRSSTPRYETKMQRRRAFTTPKWHRDSMRHTLLSRLRAGQKAGV